MWMLLDGVEVLANLGKLLCECAKRVVRLHGNAIGLFGKWR